MFLYSQMDATARSFAVAVSVLAIYPTDIWFMACQLVIGSQSFAYSCILGGSRPQYGRFKAVFRIPHRNGELCLPALGEC